MKRILALFSICLLCFAASVQAGEITRLIDGSFDASGSWSQGAWFTPPSDGKLVLTFENPDSSADGKLQIQVGGSGFICDRSGCPRPDLKLWERPILSGYANNSWDPVTIGLPSYRVEFSAYKDWGNVSISVHYWQDGVDNAGIDRVTIDFVPETIQDLVPQAQFLTSLYSEPNRPNETTVNFYAEAPGFLILKATSKGGGGGGHMLYLNDLCIGGIDTGEFWGSGADYKVLPLLDAGYYALKLRHEDGPYDYYSDNYGMRGTEVYYAPLQIDKIPPLLTLTATPDRLWPPNGKMVDVTISGMVADNLSGVASVEVTVTDEYGLVQPIITPVITNFNTTIALEASREETDKDGRRYTITAIATDRAGNKSTTSAVVLVPHDQGK